MEFSLKALLGILDLGNGKPHRFCNFMVFHSIDGVKKNKHAVNIVLQHLHALLYEAAVQM
ncbi:MAG TPA: hypothetical protein VMU30_11225 [Bacteroidota bacterium]|nr:hypothetical protein [Bacteroidota bacterium]